MQDFIQAADLGNESIRIAVRGLTKIFGEAHALPGALALAERGTSREEILAQTGCILGLRDVSFDVREGEVLVVMGLSGSGKSTTLRCINRLVEPSAGQVTVDGVAVNGLGEAELLAFRRRKFGMVFQQFALFPHRSILANVGYGLEVQGVAREEREARARAAIEQVGLAGYENARPAQLSGGMQQRAGLARALAVDADILLMDEAFSALDPLIRRDMQRQLVALQDRLRKTIVFVSHDLDEAIALGGRIVLMKDGAIVQGGTALDLLTAPADEYVARFVAHIDVLGVLTVAALTAAEGVLIPLQCETLSHRGVGQLLDTVHDVRRFTNRGLEVWGVLPTLYDGRTNHARTVLETISQTYDLAVVEPPIPKTIKFAEAPAAGRSILATSRSSKGAQAYREVAAHLAARAA